MYKNLSYRFLILKIFFVSDVYALSYLCKVFIAFGLVPRNSKPNVLKSTIELNTWYSFEAYERLQYDQYFTRLPEKSTRPFYYLTFLHT